MKQNSKKKKGGFRKNAPCLKELPRELRGNLIALGEEIHRLTEAARYDEAEKLCKSGLEMIPKPHDAYIETAWYYSALGEIFFLQEMYSPSHEYYEKTRLILESAGESDPFILLRLGEIAFETGDKETALRYLLAAYKAEGAEIFNGQDKKYFDLIKEHIIQQKGQGL